MVPIQKYLKYTNGFNQVFNYTYYRYAPLPNQLNHQFYDKEFLLNFNVMLIGLLIVVLALIVAQIVKKVKEYSERRIEENKVFENITETRKKFNAFYKFCWNNIFFIYIFFVLYSVLFDCIITTVLQNQTETIFSPSLNFVSQLFSFFIILLGMLTVFYWFYQHYQNQGSLSLD